MKKMSETVLFFGSGPVAAKSLELLAQNFDIEAVITKPQPAHHKEPFPVLALCEKLGIRAFTPNGKSELSELFAQKPVTSKLGVVIDYGFIINSDVIDYFPLGIVNSHFSLLPEWRGADPITFSILSGQKQTGISLMLINEKMDEGPLLSQTTYNIDPDETTPSLTEALIELSNHALEVILPLYVAGQTLPMPQEEVTVAVSKVPTYSRKLNKQDGVLDFNKPADVLEREIRAFTDWPKSRMSLAGMDVIITKAHTVPSTTPEPAGHIKILFDSSTLMVNTSSGYLCIDKLKPAGKSEMTVQAFLAGYRNRLS
jgi:methionyl-tRNA formyltransferase